MKINLPPDVVRDCLRTSQVFRDYVTTLLTPPDLIHLIKNIIEKNSDNKIAAIKEIRELSKTRVKEFAMLYPKYVQMIDFDSEASCIGLAESKNLVESFPQFSK